MFFKKTKAPEVKNVVNDEPSYIARDTSFEGNVICDGEIHIDGAVRGSVRAQTCLVDAHGEIHGELVAQNIFIRGRVMGPVTGTHVSIQAGSHVEGNITHETVSIENGAYVYGSMRQGGLPQTQVQMPAVNQPALNQPFFNLPADIEQVREPVDIDNVRPLKKTKPQG
jgi:cytoskeletal protein CcmA (bactofilin family)